MSTQLVSDDPQLFGPPLRMPLVLRLGTTLGIFGRPTLMEAPTRGLSCSPDPWPLPPSAAPASPGTYHRMQLHEAIDLASTEGACVFASRAGQVVESRGGRIVIDHYTDAGSWHTVYVHLGSRAVSVGDLVIPGQVIGTVGAHTSGAHLHFEIRRRVTGAPRLAAGASTNSIAVDPTRPMYWWDEIFYPDVGRIGAYPLARFDVRRVDLGVDMCIVVLDSPHDDEFVVPLYQPTAVERELVASLRAAILHGRRVSLDWRPSRFWGGDRKVIVSVRMT